MTDALRVSLSRDDRALILRWFRDHVELERMRWTEHDSSACNGLLERLRVPTDGA